MVPQESAITPELKALVGKEFPPTTWEVTKGDIIRFAQAIEDPNPLWNDEKQARLSRYGGLIAPPSFLASLVNQEATRLLFDMPTPLKRVLNGGNELESYQPIRPGDRITVTEKVVNLREGQGTLGHMLFIITEATYTNQLGEAVARGRNTFIRY
ncbi:MAG TPA: MaoC family dehydratase N-terminal domain-containing protein [Dehalococcoidia bacterium]|nr:MaoC family dehydratase N-terminal domain-containing protein [Dehalococcoidia bacterium]